MFEHFDVWKFLAGLGIFMFGMFLLEEAIKLLSGKTFKKFIKTATTGRIRSILTGTFSTAVLQSSSAVSLMTLAFVGAGVMSMQNGIGVIMGANVGTTFTGWIVATFGFKFNIEGFSLPLIALGGLGLIFFSNSPKYSGVSKLLVGLGFLFMGLDYMKLSVESFAATIDVENLPHYGVLFYVLLGFGITALMQSSSASLAITLTALNSGVIYFEEATGMVIGANMGTTITILLGAIGGVQIKKQVALSHVIFNVTTGVAALLVLPLFLKVFEYIGPVQSNYVVALAIFHTFFNVMGVILFFPFIGFLVKMLQLTFKEKITNETRFIHNISHDMPEAALHALYLETLHLLEETIAMGKLLLSIEIILPEGDSKEKLKKLLTFQMEERATIDSKYEEIKRLQSKIAVYASNIRHGELEGEEKAMIHQIIHISMSLNQVAKTFAGIKQEVIDLSESSNNKVVELYIEIQGRNEYYWQKMLESETSLPELQTMTEHQELAYGSFISTVAKLLDTSKIQDKHAASLLLINGLLTGGNRQLFNSVMNLREIEHAKDAHKSAEVSTV
jgi:phosphate:Na+ symporter